MKSKDDLWYYDMITKYFSLYLVSFKTFLHIPFIILYLSMIPNNLKYQFYEDSELILFH